MIAGACLAIILPFCASPAYEPAVTIGSRTFIGVDGVREGDQGAQEALGVAVMRSFPHLPLDIEITKIQEICRETCVTFHHRCEDDGLTCTWAIARLGNYRGGAGLFDFLRVRAVTPAAMTAAKENLGFDIGGTRVTLREADGAPFLSAEVQ